MNRQILRATIRSLAGAAIAACLSTAAFAAPVYTDWGSVVSLEGGWAQNTVSLFHSAPLVNPDNCPVTNAGYATSPEDTGADLFHTLLLSGFMNRKETAVLISGCVFSKPRIIAVSVR